MQLSVLPDTLMLIRGFDISSYSLVNCMQKKVLYVLQIMKSQKDTKTLYIITTKSRCL